MDKRSCITLNTTTLGYTTKYYLECSNLWLRSSIV